MFADIVIPDGNEKEFIEMAERLGYSAIVLAYPLKVKLPDIKSDNIKINFARIVDAKELNKANSSKEIIIARAGAENRMLFESKKIDIIFELENKQKKDFIHHRASGMNHVLAKLAKQHNISIAFSFSLMLNNPAKRADIMARMSQNIRLCRKYRISLIVASFAKNPYEMRSPRDLMAVMGNIGMEGGEAKKALNKALEKFK